MSSGKKALVITASVIGGLFLLLIIVGLASDDGGGDEPDAAAATTPSELGSYVVHIRNDDDGTIVARATMDGQAEPCEETLAPGESFTCDLGVPFDCFGHHIAVWGDRLGVGGFSVDLWGEAARQFQATIRTNSAPVVPIASAEEDMLCADVQWLDVDFTLINNAGASRYAFTWVLGEDFQWYCPQVESAAVVADGDTTTIACRIAYQEEEPGDWYFRLHVSWYTEESSFDPIWEREWYVIDVRESATVTVTLNADGTADASATGAENTA